MRRVQWISFGPGAELMDLDIEFWSSVRVKGWLKLSVFSELYFMFFSSWIQIELN